MPDIKQLKLKISSTKNIKKITSAMEVISTIKLQKVKTHAQNLREYMKAFLEMLSAVDSYTDIFPQPPVHANKELVILVSSDKGLCGSLNSALFKKMSAHYGATPNDIDVYVIGKKGREFAQRLQYNVVGSLDLPDVFQPEDLTPLYDYIVSAHESGQYHNIRVWYNFFQNTMKQIPVSFQLFPLSMDQFVSFMGMLGLQIEPKTVTAPYMEIEPDREVILQKSYDIMMNTIVYGAVLHNKTGEFAARMLAMKGAKDNASNIISDLTLAYNKARQEAITKEVLEIVSAKSVLDS